MTSHDVTIASSGSPILRVDDEEVASVRSTQSGYIVNRYDSIAQLLQALVEEPLFLKFGEAWVCVHPGLVREPSEYQALRQQVEASGLELLLTATANPDGVELRRYTA